MLVSGTTSCCHVNRKIEVGQISPETYQSFIYIESKNYIKKCLGDRCSEYVGVASGSGFSLQMTPDYTLAVTAGHLCVPQEGTYRQDMSVTILGGETYNAVILMTILETDTCVIAIPNAQIPPLKVASENVKRGERVYSMGAPFGIFDHDMIAMFEGFYAGTTGGVKVLGGSEVDLQLSGYTIPARPGSSGGPILNSRGEVVGMTILAHPAFENFTLSPRQNDLRSVLNTILRASSGS